MKVQVVTRVYARHIPTDTARITLDGDEAHHLTRVVRAGVGDTVRVFDGSGHEWHARVTDVGRQSAVLVIDAAVTPVAEPPIRVTLGIGVLKGDQMDTVIREATVMGVSAIVPLGTDHVAVPSRAWRADAAGTRWRRVAIAAAKQCGRAVVPEISAVVPYAHLWAMPPAAMTLACVEPSVAPTAMTRLPDWRAEPRPESVLLLVGPEGGWSAAEAATMAEHGARPVSLGPRTLRAESAPAIALTLVWATWGWA